MFKINKIINTIKKFLHNQSRTVQISIEIREAIDAQTVLVNRRLTEMNGTIKHLAEVLGRQYGDVLNLADIEHKLASNDLHVNNGYQAPPVRHISAIGTVAHDEHAEHDLPRREPLMFAYKTFNPSHPDYDATAARNFPGKVFNHQSQVQNRVFSELRKMMRGDEIADNKWPSILRSALEEAKTVPHAEQIFERKEFVEHYLKQLEMTNKAVYRPGWVNLDDAVFLYWVVRRLQPKVIVQTGVCNGLSSAFMMLALAKNGNEGSLHVVDMPPVYDPNEPAWKIKGKIYGVTIPEGKTSGWLVPDAYRDRFEVLNGDAKELLPPLLQRLGQCDMFYHDSDHTYDHMMFEFEEAKNYMSEGSIAVSDDISWNASLWDFADRYQAPAYNFRGSMGIACF